MLSSLPFEVPASLRDKARRLGLGFAMLSRLALLFSQSWVMGLTETLFSVLGQDISGRDLVLLFGGLFLLYKASHEIFVEVEARSVERLRELEGTVRLLLDAQVEEAPGSLYEMFITGEAPCL